MFLSLASCTRSKCFVFKESKNEKNASRMEIFTLLQKESADVDEQEIEFTESKDDSQLKEYSQNIHEKNSKSRNLCTRNFLKDKKLTKKTKRNRKTENFQKEDKSAKKIKNNRKPSHIRFFSGNNGVSMEIP